MCWRLERQSHHSNPCASPKPNTRIPFSCCVRGKWMRQNISVGNPVTRTITLSCLNITLLFNVLTLSWAAPTKCFTSSAAQTPPAFMLLAELAPEQGGVLMSLGAVVIIIFTAHTVCIHRHTHTEQLHIRRTNSSHTLAQSTVCFTTLRPRALTCRILVNPVLQAGLICPGCSIITFCVGLARVCVCRMSAVCVSPCMCTWSDVCLFFGARHELFRRDY